MGNLRDFPRGYGKPRTSHEENYQSRRLLETSEEILGWTNYVYDEKREFGYMLDPWFPTWDLQIPRKYADYFLLWQTAQQRKNKSQSKKQGRLNLTISHCSISRTHEEKGLKVSVMKDVTGSREAQPRRDKKWVRTGDLSGTCSKEVLRSGGRHRNSCCWVSVGTRKT